MIGSKKFFETDVSEGARHLRNLRSEVDWLVVQQPKIDRQGYRSPRDLRVMLAMPGCIG